MSARECVTHARNGHLDRLPAPCIILASKHNVSYSRLSKYDLLLPASVTHHNSRFDLLLKGILKVPRRHIVSLICTARGNAACKYLSQFAPGIQMVCK